MCLWVYMDSTPSNCHKKSLDTDVIFREQQCWIRNSLLFNPSSHHTYNINFYCCCLDGDVMYLYILCIFEWWPQILKCLVCYELISSILILFLKFYTFSSMCEVTSTTTQAKLFRNLFHFSRYIHFLTTVDATSANTSMGILLQLLLMVVPRQIYWWDVARSLVKNIISCYDKVV